MLIASKHIIPIFFDIPGTVPAERTRKENLQAEIDRGTRLENTAIATPPNRRLRSMQHKIRQINKAWGVSLFGRQTLVGQDTGTTSGGI